MKKKKYLIFSGILILLILGVIGFTYAYWSITHEQTNFNIVNSDCLNVEFKEDANSAIHLSQAYPIRDEDGKSLIPYTFTLTNKCASFAKYQINLENMNTTTMKEEYLKLMINPKNEEGNISLLSNFTSVDKTFADAVNSRKIYEGYLNVNESIDFELRLWMDESVTAEQTDSMNKSYSGKVSIQVSYVNGIPPLEKYGINDIVVTTGNGLYEVTHDDATITYTSNETVIHNLKKTEYRYAGANPNNYVIFNNELWRIIGLVNTPEGQRIKLTRNESIGAYSWDSSSGINEGFGVNEWSQADLMKLLNFGYDSEPVGGSLYWNKTSGFCYNGQNNATTSCDFTSTGLGEEAKSMIDTVTWITTSSQDYNFSVVQLYDCEKSSGTISSCSNPANCDNTERNMTWYGQIGLMYLSDYGYATSGGSITTRSICLTNRLKDWSYIDSVSDCKNNDWLYNSSINEWTISPHYGGRMHAMSVTKYYYTIADPTSAAQAVSPTIYLKTGIKVQSGDGSVENPYILS